MPGCQEPTVPRDREPHEVLRAVADARGPRLSGRSPEQPSVRGDVERAGPRLDGYPMNVMARFARRGRSAVLPGLRGVVASAPGKRRDQQRHDQGTEPRFPASEPPYG